MDCAAIEPIEFHNLVVLANRHLRWHEKEKIPRRLYDPLNSSMMDNHGGVVCGSRGALADVKISVLAQESFWSQMIRKGMYRHRRYLYARMDCANECKWGTLSTACEMVTYDDQIIRELYFRGLQHIVLFECAM
ncbi:unnamed protein product [Toxocara canis]|uniref:Uncharacterized protein n=2 Tax=Toxocara canis TaxID=6265 RepID=A0A183VB24_TOXCA|nr:unnamed protein product [Toxocara canis]